VCSSDLFARVIHTTPAESESAFVVQMPEDSEVWMNCHASTAVDERAHSLRLQSARSWHEGDLAHAMSVFRVDSPNGRRHFIGCLGAEAPPTHTRNGWGVTVVADHVSWLHRGREGRLWAMNPESSRQDATVPLSGIISVSAASDEPAVIESRGWLHGVWLGVTSLGLEDRAINPLATRGWCIAPADIQVARWLMMGRTVRRPPRMFRFNARSGVLDARSFFGAAAWVVNRIDGLAGARDTPLGLIPSGDHWVAGLFSVSEGGEQTQAEVHACARRYHTMRSDLQRLGPSMPASVCLFHEFVLEAFQRQEQMVQ
jgi:GTP-dependent phosphoenolpyruvate carboxykinase